MAAPIILAKPKFCKSIFNNAESVDFSLNSIEMAGNYLTFCRPFIPIAILDSDPVNKAFIDFVNSKNFPDFFENLMSNFKQASYNLVNNPGLTPSYVDGEFGAYLAQNISVDSKPCNQNRFSETGLMLSQFWSKWGTVTETDETIWQTRFLQFVEVLKSNVDKRYFIPPGQYFIEAGNSAYDNFVNILAANPTWYSVKILILELRSIA